MPKQNKKKRPSMTTAFVGLCTTFMRTVLDGENPASRPLKGMALRVARIIYAVSGDVARGDLSLRAMSLVYTTLITLAPLLALSFSILKGFGVHNQIEPFLLNLLEPLGADGQNISNRIIEFVDNIEVGVLGLVGLGFLVYSVIALMQKIERAFNFIWRVERHRTFAQRFSDYISIILIWPFFILISAGLTTGARQLAVTDMLGLNQAYEALWAVLAVIIPYVIMALAFAFIFAFMPNTKVRFLPALIGGLVTAIAWKIMSFIFSTLIAGSASYVAIYAAFATLIIFMVWVYLAWFVVLLGASISFYVQNPRFILVGSKDYHLSNRVKEKLGLMIMDRIGRDFYKGKNKWTALSLSRALNMPISAVQDVLKILEQGGVLATTQTHDSIYVPAVPLDKTTLADVLTVIRKEGEKAALSYDRLHAGSIVDTILDSYSAPLFHKPVCALWMKEKPAVKHRQSVKKRKATTPRIKKAR